MIFQEIHFHLGEVEKLQRGFYIVVYDGGELQKRTWGVHSYLNS